MYYFIMGKKVLKSPVSLLPISLSEQAIISKNTCSRRIDIYLAAVGMLKFMQLASHCLFSSTNAKSFKEVLADEIFWIYC